MSLSNRTKKSRLIGIAGTHGAGKDTAANHLGIQYSFMNVSTGDILRAEASKRGLPHDRATLIEIAVELRAAHNSIGALMVEGVNLWQSEADTYPSGLVISGIRVLGEAQEFKKMGGILLFIDAPISERYQRTIRRSRGVEAKTGFQRFAEEERVEFEGLGGPERPNLRAIKSIADLTIMNDRTPELFIAELDSVLGLPHLA